MYNEELETLIDAALTDGELTEKEKQVLFKKAQALGVDLDEFEMVLDARLVKLKQKQDEETKTSAPKSNKYGDVKKCPACGAIVQSYQGSCSECGYAFEGVDANAAVKELAALLRKTEHDASVRMAKLRKEKMKADAERYKAGMKGDESGEYYIEEDIDSQLKNIINTFPIPMEKATLLAFATWLSTQCNGYSSLTDAYKNKYEECIQRAKMAFPNDKTFAPILAEYEHKKQRRRKLVIIGVCIGCVVLICSIIFYYIIYEWLS